MTPNPTAMSREAEAQASLWRPMKDAPTGVPIVAKHKPNDATPHGWIATIIRDFDDPDEDRRGGLDTILHYNGDTLRYGFHGCWDGWLTCEEAATLRSHPATAGGKPGEGGLREALFRLKTECEIEGLDLKPGFDAWVSWANKLLSDFRPSQPTAQTADLSYSGAPMPPDGIEGCVYCGQPFKDGDLVLDEVEGGEGHVACMGPDRDSYVGPDGEPLKEGEPIPTGRPWKPTAQTAPLAAVELREALERARPLVADRVAAQSGRIGDGDYARILAQVDAALTRPVAEEPAAPVEGEDGLRAALELIRDFARSSVLVRNDALDCVHAVASRALAAAPKANGVGTGGEAWHEDLDLSDRARSLINSDPRLLSLLYDLDLLPEQLFSQDEKTPGLIKAYHRLYGVLYAFQALAPSQGNDEGAR